MLRQSFAAGVKQCREAPDDALVFFGVYPPQRPNGLAKAPVPCGRFAVVTLVKGERLATTYASPWSARRAFRAIACAFDVREHLRGLARGLAETSPERSQCPAILA